MQQPTNNHKSVALMRHLPSHQYNFRRRPIRLPFAWRNISGPTGLASYAQWREWRLVLDACRIPYRFIFRHGQYHLYVPPLLERLALNELQGYAAEAVRPRAPHSQAPTNPLAPLSLIFLLPLLLWHGLRAGWWAAPSGLPPVSTWLPLGSLDSVMLDVYGQYYRLFTALTLHTDASHLMGNLTFGGIFLFLLARRCGIGHALLLGVVGGAAGNALSLVLHSLPSAAASLLEQGPYSSIGFSTALFALIGALAGTISWQQDKIRMLWPVAAAVGLLSMLGAGGGNSDYPAHICGLVVGILLGLGKGYGQSRHWPEPPQWLAGLTALCLPITAWRMAFAP